jgi:polyphosphate kinase 2 (PPK2 family)
MAQRQNNDEKPKLKRKQYEKEMRRLQAELCHLQEWVKAEGRQIVVVFEGRDGAGKGGTIKAITERVSPRVFRVVALPAPSAREKSQLYIQRYMQHFPAAGEIAIFDRSWYNAPASNTSWVSAPKKSTAASSNFARRSKNTW